MAISRCLFQNSSTQTRLRTSGKMTKVMRTASNKANNARLSARLRDSLAGEKLLAFSETCTSVANHAAVEMHNTVLWPDAKNEVVGGGSPERRAPVAGNGRGGWLGGHRVESSPRFAWWVTFLGTPVGHRLRKAEVGETEG